MAETGDTKKSSVTRIGGDAGDRLRSAFTSSELLLPVGIMAILVLLLIPLPTWLLDLSLSISITISVLILMTVIFIVSPLELTSFPTILLIATMLRLGLNVASTRLILSEGHTGTDAAGQVIQAFGGFVAGGNYVIGVIVFAILVLINFIVITKGAGRIAEVAARFTLDAMPGKQMAIDADMSSGLINEDQARARRKELESESSFFGAMDGASKFVRGDAIAGLLITFINIIGGIIIGVVQRDMSLADAAENYTLLTIGDGLVSQVPALIVSVGAGLLVTKAGVSGATDKALFGQLSGYPSALGMASGMLLLMAAIPDLPAWPFLIMSLAAGAGAFFVSQGNARRKVEEETKVLEQEAAAEMAPKEEPISAALQIDLIRLELGYGLLPLINASQEHKLTDQIKSLRRQLAGDLGFVMPAVRIQDNLQLPANTYVIRVKEIEAGRGDLRPNMQLCMDPHGEKISLPGEATVEPTFGLPAVWIQENQREEAMFRGYTVVDSATVITTHITEIIKDNMSELLSYSETQKLLDELPQGQQKLVSDLIPNQIALGAVQRVLQNLLNERVSIRDLPTILEGISEAVGYTRNLTNITEHVRSRLSRQISDANTNDSGYVTLVTLTPAWEQAFLESLVGQGDERQLAMAPSKLQEFIGLVRTVFERQAMQGETPALLVSPNIRPYVRSVIERFRPVTVVMSQNEIHPKARIKTVDSI
ncbi:flagellar biosynthesis protein FlhA [Rhodospirillaceae bacterium KN72]|uniref:Flagellar biosynthesis protein FlhA n=1 Tax=Pacificispira spongiicola TaxID=2729598 RepID=A0A7Y0E339_9PROT|nr:flagellar biosynthesis protein FlhA [Pacificispira spongiicola]NMM46360.1 flagellar biosynthesis protein FlhA [Pacificispira spongiicola]